MDYAFANSVGCASMSAGPRTRSATCEQRKASVSNVTAAMMHFTMQDIGRKSPSIKGPRGPEFQKDEGRGGVATKVRDPEVKKKRKLGREDETEKEKEWRVLLHNDNVHTFDYVTHTITEVVKTISRKKAFRITMQAHSSGVSTVTVTWKELAEDYCRGLQKHGLTSSIAPDSHFHKS
ncbi:hypothetical protein NDN08_005506 [Rhodosorus marinus]|uniref:Adaptor protein ClpS core domain-containing protein n=1 Tax=Rhodosorus marinus TaxID=101924 RepID=A0AAV8V4V3_9RHOD|nr:hypothetical protein NDN08_005506 [Rhodosorus marinus]